MTEGQFYTESHVVAPDYRKACGVSDCGAVDSRRDSGCLATGRKGTAYGWAVVGGSVVAIAAMYVRRETNRGRKRAERT